MHDKARDDVLNLLLRSTDSDLSVLRAALAQSISVAIVPGERRSFGRRRPENKLIMKTSHGSANAVLWAAMAQMGLLEKYVDAKFDALGPSFTINTDRVSEISALISEVESIASGVKKLNFIMDSVSKPFIDSALSELKRNNCSMNDLGQLIAWTNILFVQRVEPDPSKWPAMLSAISGLAETLVRSKKPTH